MYASPKITAYLTVILVTHGATLQNFAVIFAYVTNFTLIAKIRHGDASWTLVWSIVALHRSVIRSSEIVGGGDRSGLPRP